MPRDRPDERTVQSTRPDVAERFTARDSSGHAVVVEQLCMSVREDAIGGMMWSHPPSTAFRLESGEPVERVEESSFRIVRTGELLRREEGNHGITHHTQHQTPAR